MIISSAAISEAVNLCTLNNVRFSSVGERCFSLLETSGLLDQIQSEEADELFLSLIQSELEDEDTDESFDRNQAVWALAA